MPKINKLGVIGSPIDHSLSPFIHSRFARQANLNIDYRPYKVESDELDIQFQNGPKASNKQSSLFCNDSHDQCVYTFLVE